MTARKGWKDRLAPDRVRDGEALLRTSSASKLHVPYIDYMSSRLKPSALNCWSY